MGRCEGGGGGEHLYIGGNLVGELKISLKYVLFMIT